MGNIEAVKDVVVVVVSCRDDKSRTAALRRTVTVVATFYFSFGAKREHRLQVVVQL